MIVRYVSGSYRVARGGSWHCVPQGVRVAYRSFSTPVYRNNILGLRLMRRFM